MLGPVIEILEPMTREEFSGKDGRVWCKYTQRAAIHRGERYPVMCEWPLAFRGKAEDHLPKPEQYEPGHYVLAGLALDVDRNGNVRFNDRVRLVEVDGDTEQLRAVS
jgi:hypothetical protein